MRRPKMALMLALQGTIAVDPRAYLWNFRRRADQKRGTMRRENKGFGEGLMKTDALAIHVKSFELSDLAMVGWDVERAVMSRAARKVERRRDAMTSQKRRPFEDEAALSEVSGVVAVALGLGAPSCFDSLFKSTLGVFSEATIMQSC